MTARLPQEPKRVTNWLAGWLDYVCATLLTAGRWLRVPSAQSADEPVMMAAFAPTIDALGPHWHDSGDAQPGNGRIVRALEIVMLSMSFFLAAHLLSGGTPTVSAPNVDFGFAGSRAQAAALSVPAAPGKQVTVDATAFMPAPAPSPVAPEQAAPAEAPAQEAAVLAPAAGSESHTAAVAPEPATPPPAQAVVQQPPAPAPAPSVEVPAPVPSQSIPAEADRYLTVEEFRAAALTAGWSADLLPALETVARCESHFRTGAFHLGARGIMQVLPNWFEFAGLDGSRWYDPVTNLTAALAAYNEHTRYSGDGWSGWTCKP